MILFDWLFIVWLLVIEVFVVIKEQVVISGLVGTFLGLGDLYLKLILLGVKLFLLVKEVEARKELDKS